MISALGYLGFEVSDTAAWRTYAEDFLGLMPGPDVGGDMSFRIDAHAWRFLVREGAADDLYLLGLETADAAALQAVERRLTEVGAAFERGSETLKALRRVRDLIVLTDPSGLTVEIYWGPTLLLDEPFRSTAGVCGFRTGAQGAGHVVLQSDRIDAMRAFYVDILGFRLSDTVGLQLSPQFTLMLEFYHCNPRHHTLALTPVPASKRLHHFMVEMATLDDVGFALDRIAKCGVKQQLSLGKHSNDQMVSFYAKTPSGFEVEVGCGGVEVDEADWKVVHHDKMSIWGHKPV